RGVVVVGLVVAQLGVQRDDVPRAEVEAVVALGRVAGQRTEVRVVAGRVVLGRAAGAAVRLVLVVSRNRTRLRVLHTPGGVLHLPERGQPAAAVLLVAKWEHRVDRPDSAGRLQEVGGPLLP